jgi:F0F1-type ATP synthase membrane subunit c/vacuolar-type H+-ATPase subunit K
VGTAHQFLFKKTMSRIPQATLQQQFKTTNYIGLAMMASVFIYAAIVLAIDKGYIPYKASANINFITTFKYILLVLAVLHYFIIRFFQKFSAKSANYLASGAIITFALSEAVAIYGLVLFFLTGNATDFFIFMAISLLYFYLFYPKYADWERLWIQETQTNPTS